MKKKSDYVFSEDLEKEYKKNNLFIEMDIVPDECHEVMENPFLYDSASSNVTLFSIEDFGLNYKGKNVYLHSIIRNPNLETKKKLKVFKKYLRKSRRDFKHQVKELKHVKSNANEELLNMPFAFDSKKRRLTAFIFIMINLFFILMFWLSGLSIWGNGWFAGVMSALNTRMINIPKYKFLVWFSSAFDFGMIVYFIVYRIFCRRFTKQYKKHLRMVTKTTKSYDRKFRKSYNKVRRYYIKEIKKENNYNFIALNLNSLWNQKRSFKDALDSSEAWQIKTNKVKYYQKIHKLLKGVLYSLVFILNVVLLVYLIIG